MHILLGLALTWLGIMAVVWFIAAAVLSIITAAHRRAEERAWLRQRPQSPARWEREMLASEYGQEIMAARARFLGTKGASAH